MISEILVPIAFFLFLAAIIITPGYLKSRDRQEMHKTLRQAFERGQPVPPEMIEALQNEKAKPAPERDLRRGVVFLAIAGGFVALAFAIRLEEVESFYPLLGVAAFPGLLGLGFLLLWAATRGRA